MPPVPATAKEELRAINILFYALAAGIVIFALMIAGINFLQDPPIDDKKITRIFLFTVVAVAAVCQVAAHVLYKKGLTVILRFELPLKEKLKQYRPILIQYFALCEGPALFSLIIFFLTGNPLVLDVTAAMLVFMFMKRPAKSKIFNELQLNTAEQMELN